jgi:hypothetical protein
LLCRTLPYPLSLYDTPKSLIVYFTYGLSVSSDNTMSVFHSFHHDRSNFFVYKRDKRSFPCISLHVPI